MKRALWLVLLLVGCGGGKSPSDDLGAPDASVADLAPSTDFFVGRYSCQKPLDEYCAQQGGCIRQLADADKPDAGCNPNLGIVAASCGSHVYITSYVLVRDYTPSGYVDAGVDVLRIMVYDIASGQLVAVLADGSAGNSDCLAGPGTFADPEILGCPGLPTDPNGSSDGGVLQICPYDYTDTGACGVHGGRLC